MSGGTITTASIVRLLWPGLRKVFGESYTAHAREWSRMFNEFTSEKNYELDQQFEGFGLATKKPEGQGIDYDSQQQGYTPRYDHVVFGKGFEVTKEAFTDQLYDLFTRRARALGFSINQTMEVVGANVFNNGFDSNFLMPGGDGKSLFATDHPNGPSGGTFSNTTAAADFQETALETQLIAIGNATDTRGLKINIRPTTTILPVALTYEACRVFKSVLQNDTANNAVSAINDLNAVPGGYMISHFLTDVNAWFTKTDVDYGLTHFERWPVEFEEDNVFNTSSARFKATYRDSFGWTDPRGCWGNAGGS